MGDSCDNGSNSAYDYLFFGCVFVQPFPLQDIGRSLCLGSDVVLKFLQTANPCMVCARRTPKIRSAFQGFGFWVCQIPSYNHLTSTVCYIIYTYIYIHRQQKCCVICLPSVDSGFQGCGFRGSLLMGPSTLPQLALAALK